jgi:3-oxoadipate enol-lactonase
MTVVLCGSLGSTAEMWEPQAGVVNDAVRVEWPGHGAEPVWDPGGIDGLVEHVLRAVDGRFTFVGLSLGGAVGMRLAAEHPDRVERLVLACTSARFGEPAQWHERAAIVRAQGLDAIVDAVMARWFGAGFPELERWRAMFLSVDPEGYALCCEALAGVDATPFLSRISAPTLVVAGSEDPTSPPPEGEALARGIDGAELVAIPGAHHLANVEHPESFNTLLEGLL